jgi:hypothetical protein
MFPNRLPSILTSQGSFSQVIYIHESLRENALSTSFLYNVKYLQYHEYVHACVICTPLFRAGKQKRNISR